MARSPSYTAAMFFGFMALLFSIISQGTSYWTVYEADEANHLHSGLYYSCYNSKESEIWDEQEYDEACYDIGEKL